MSSLRLVPDAAGRGGEDPDVVLYLRWGRDLAGLSANTLRSRHDVLRRLHSLLGVPLRQVTSRDLLRWESACVAGLAANSRKSYVCHVSAFYRWLVKMDGISEDPTAVLTRPLTPKPMPRPIAEDDLRLAIAAASPKLAAMLVLCSYAGLRCAEVAHLNWQDISHVDGQAVLHVRHGKGDKDRSVPIGTVVVDALQRYGARSRGPVFYGHNAQQIKSTSVSKIINSHLLRLGIDATAHKLRHRFATVSAPLVDNDLSLIAELCGWESLETARHYVLPDRSKTRRLLGGLDDLASASPSVLATDDDGPTDERFVAGPYRPTVAEVASHRAAAAGGRR